MILEGNYFCFFGFCEMMLIWYVGICMFCVCWVFIKYEVKCICLMNILKKLVSYNSDLILGLFFKIFRVLFIGISYMN